MMTSGESNCQGSIVQSISKVSVEADFQILVSIYNPNVMDAKIESGTAVLFHKHNEVNTFRKSAITRIALGLIQI